MERMFNSARQFNADISQWDVSSVTRMDYMFYQAYAFNADISQWDVSSVTNMDMFYNKGSFNCGYRAVGRQLGHEHARYVCLRRRVQRGHIAVGRQLGHEHAEYVL